MVSNWLLITVRSIMVAIPRKNYVFLRVLLWDSGFNGSFTSIIVAVWHRFGVMLHSRFPFLFFSLLFSLIVDLPIDFDRLSTTAHSFSIFISAFLLLCSIVFYCVLQLPCVSLYLSITLFFFRFGYSGQNCISNLVKYIRHATSNRLCRACCMGVWYMNS